MARFARCGHCGRSFPDVEPMPDISRNATVMTSDLQGSTALGERLDPESLREVLDLYFEAMRLVIEAHSGMIEKIIGDAIVAVFGLSDGRADHAPRAVAAVAECQAELAALNALLADRWGVQLVNRTGLATGTLVVRAAGEREHILTGDAVRVSGWLEQSAPPFEALLDEPTYAAVKAAVPVEVEPCLAQPRNADPVPSFRLVSADAVLAAWALPSAAEAPAGRICPNCGTENPTEFCLCGACGGPLVAKRAAPTRKTVTIVFAALHARDRLGGPLAAGTQQAVMGRAFEASRTALARHGGTIEKFIGDAVMAVFGLPLRHEDDALRAVRAALEMRSAIGALAAALETESGTTLEVAIGVNTGEVITGEPDLGQRLVTGDAVNVAARLEQAAAPGEIIVGGLTEILVRGSARLEQVASLTLKGKSTPVPAHRLVGVAATPAAARRSATALVGRERELALLAEAFAAARNGPACRIVTVVGSAGVGKTRLISEFLGTVGADATLVSGRCLSYGDGITFWPVVEAVRDAAGLREADTPAVAIRKLRRLVGDDGVVERVAAAVGLRDAPFQVGELFWGIRRFLEILARRRPLVVAFDDIQWAEPTFLDLLGHLTSTSAGAPILLLCTAREELLEKYPGWGQGPEGRTIVLSPLSYADAARVAENLLGEVGLVATIRDRIVAAAEGNPLFVEQLVAMLTEAGILRRSGDRWETVGDLSRLEIPPTIHALLAARLDALPEGERAVIDPASVIGLVFARLALQAIVDGELRDRVPERLDQLAARQLVRPAEPAGGDGLEYRFGHQMIREAAYAGLLKRRRASLHERFVAWADEANRASDRATEFEEILGYHLEQAHRYLAELGPLDDHGHALGIDASRRLGSAGQRAFVRGDMPATANLVRRSAALLPAGDPSRPRLLIQQARALTENGERSAADQALGSAEEEARGLGDVGLETMARLERLMTRYWTDPTQVEGDIEAHLRAGLAVLETVGYEAGIARAWLALASVRMVDARWGVAAEAVARTIEHARLAGDRILEIRAGPNLALCAQLGPTPVPEAIRRCGEVIGSLGGDRKAEAVALRSLAHLHAMQGDFEAAREEYRRSRAMLEELGWRFHAALTSIDSGPIEMLARNPVAAEAELRRDYATLESLGERNYISTVAALLAESLFAQGRFDEAGAMESTGAGVAAPDDVVTQVILRSVRGRLLARAGRHVEAEEVCREAVELSRTEDDPRDQASALSALAHVLAASGKRDQAAAVQTEALALYQSKGDLVSAAVARRWLEELAGRR
jgi:class 3 adenylate cyclase/tetratricopeptide (TPR) repeat protein